MKKLQEYLEYQTQIALIIIGFALVYFGIYFFFEIKFLEDTYQMVQMKRYLRIVYDFGGKYTILTLLVLPGIIALVYGVKQFVDLKLENDSKL
jgi:hypothetical protein